MNAKRTPRTLLLVIALGTSCATAGESRQQYLALSTDGRELYDKYRQFMTEHQQQEFLTAPTDGDRQTQIRNLHIEERLSRYPDFVQRAIWSRTPVVGMDKTALFLSLGRPTSVDRSNFDPDTHLLPAEHWFYRRGELVDQSYDLTIVNDEVTEVKVPNVK
jgi:hypothetical protein